MLGIVLIRWVEIAASVFDLLAMTKKWIRRFRRNDKGGNVRKVCKYERCEECVWMMLLGLGLIRLVETAALRSQ